MASRTLTVNIVGDPESFSRAMRRVSKDADDTGRRLKFFGDQAGSSSEAFSGLTLRIGGLGGSLTRLAPALAAATPALVAMGGAATAVAGSFSAAAAGAGALGTGLAASLAPVLVVGKQVTSRFEAIKEAYDALQTAQKEGTEAARKNAQQALADLSKTERAMVDTFGRLSGLQTRVLGGASNRIIGALSGAIDRVAPSLEKLAQPFNRLGDAIARVIDRAGRSLSGPEWTGALRAFVESASALVGPFAKTFGSIANIMRDVARAALPLVRSGMRDIARAFADLDESATRGKIREVVRDLVGHTRSWWNLTKQVGVLLFRIFNGGAKDGKSLVDTLTGIVRQWNRFLSTREGQREMRQFFRDSVEVTKDLVEIFAALTAGVFKAAAAVNRIIAGLQGFEASVGKIDAAINRWISGAWRDMTRAFRALPGIVKNLGSRVLEAAKGIGKTVIDGIVAGIKSAGGAVGNAISDVVGAVNPFGDGKGIGEGIGRSFGVSGLGGGALMGADPDLGPFAALGQRMGLRTTSGLFGRENSVTATGNKSYHSTGDAIDMSGSSSAMKRFASTVARVWGGNPRLRELIYSPLGYSMQDGRRTAPYAVADHYDHVHVAYTGPFGDGPGIRGKVSVFGPPLEGAGTTASGASSSAPGIALFQRSTLGKLFRVAVGGRSAVLRQTDIGPAPWTGRKIDITGAGARKMGIDPYEFPTDSIGTAMLLSAGRGRGGGGASGAGGGGGGAAGSKGVLVGSVVPGTEGFGAPKLSFEGQLAKVDVQKAKAERRDDLSGLIKALRAERALKRRRLRRIRRVLRGRLSQARRTRLLQEEAQLIGEIGELTATIKEYKADRAGGAQTITQAEQLEAGVDPGAQEGETVTDTGGGGAEAPGPDPALEQANRLAEEHNNLLREQNANQQAILRLAQQGPQILASVIAAIEGDIGGRVGLGFQTVGYAGSGRQY